MSVDLPKAGVYGFHFIHSFTQHTLSTIFHVPGTVIHPVDKMINKA